MRKYVAMIKCNELVLILNVLSSWLKLSLYASIGSSYQSAIIGKREFIYYNIKYLCFEMY